LFFIALLIIKLLHRADQNLQEKKCKLNEKLLVEETTPNSWQPRPYESITSQEKSKLNKPKNFLGWQQGTHVLIFQAFPLYS